ncbi:MAG: PKD domain-containing protein [Deltaproteobacteria bacterium]|nr:PKD domain-containing protein [Deltaproteobacteria bacterium]
MERLDMRIGAGLRAVTAGAGVRALAPWLAATALLGAATTAQAGNFPPVAKAAATPYEALLGEVVLFDSAGTFDPDDGPQPLTLDWDLGDGTVASGPQTSHAYDTLGLHTAVLTASDGVSTTLAFIDVVVVLPPTATAPRHSAALVLSPDQTELAVANTDSDSVSIVSVDRRSVVELEVGDAPLSLAYADDGSALVVACGGDRGLWHVDPVAGTAARSTELPSTPGELVALADGRVLVTLPSLAAVAIVDDGEVSLIATAASPRAIAVDAGGTTAWVTHFLTTGDHGLVSRVDLQTGELVGEITLAEDLGPDTTASGRGFPNLLGTAVLTPAGDALWVGGLKSNTGRGAFVDGNDLTPHNRVRGAMFAIDAVGGELELTTRRLDTNDADSVAAIAFSPRGRYAYLLHRGAGMLSVYDLPKAALVDASDGSVASFETRIDLGHVPDAIAITDDGTRAWVRNELTRDVMELDLTEPTAAAVVATIAVTDEPLSPQLLLGKQMFNRSRGPEHSEQNYIACASCHPSGGHDGRTWDFTQTGEGLRNTIDLRGHAGMGHGPVHWSANFDEIQDFENDIVDGFGGSGLAHDGMPPFAPLEGPPNAGRSAELDALAAYVTSLDAAPGSPWRTELGGLDAAAQRGKALFYDEVIACASCHAPPRFTDSTLAADAFVLHDVGTLLPSSGGRLGGPLVGLDTPSVLGVWATPPYLHDGRAADLHEVLTLHNPDDQHGHTSQLSDAELDDLIAFLLALDGSADELPPDDGGDDSSGGDDGRGSSSGEDADGGGDTTGTTEGEDATTTAGATAEADHGGCACRTRAGSSPAFALMTITALALRRRRKEATP